MSTIEKALRLLEYFSVDRPEIGLTEFKNMASLDKGTAHRYLNSLRECGFLEQNPATKAYRLGPAVIRLATVREKTVPLKATAMPYVDEMAGKLQELAHASLPQSNGMSNLYMIDGGISGTRVGFDVAEILPYYATSSGIAMLAYGNPDYLVKVKKSKRLKFTEETAISNEDIERLVNDCKSKGFAAAGPSFDNEVCSVALPFFDHTGRAIGTLAIATPSSRMTRNMQANITALLANAARKLSRDLSGQVPSELLKLWSHLEQNISDNTLLGE